jgi:electron transport complex protein RnfB
MPQTIFGKLARRLDAIPNGFPATTSGVELKILERIFAPEQAELAAELRLTPEPAGEIASRLNRDPDRTAALLREMARRGQIRARRREGGLVFALMPFIVGIYENQITRMDGELAALCEQYFQETGGSMMGSAPSVHRVIPVEESISVDLEIFPYERAVQLIEGARSWGVRKCICREQQRLIGKGCDHEEESCLVFAPVEHAFDDNEEDRPITREESLSIFRRAEEAGLIHSTANHRGPLFYICNCCTCCCGIMRGVAEWGNPDAMARSDFQAAVTAEDCTGCESCLDRCRFGALSIAGEVCRVDPARCLGCGQCVSVCPAEALRLERRPSGEAPKVPENEGDWMRWRAQERGMDISPIL